MRTIEFTLDQPTLSQNAWDRLHWSAKRRHTAELALLVRSAMHRAGVRRPNEPLARVFVEITRGSVGTLDHPNAVGGVKPLLDTLVRATRKNPHGQGLIEDDNPDCMDYRVRQVPARRGAGFTRVLIAEVLESPACHCPAAWRPRSPTAAPSCTAAT